MVQSLHPTADDSRTNATFDELMWAFARPGLARRLPVPGFAALAESLIDRECSVHLAADAAFPADLADKLAATGARPVALEAADYVFAPAGSAAAVAALAALRVGTLAYPDESATLFVPARLGEGQLLRLSGPGIREAVTLRIGGIDASFWPVRAQAIRYPLGWDAYLVDADQLVGLPRSTMIEVL